MSTMSQKSNRYCHTLLHSEGRVSVHWIEKRKQKLVQHWRKRMENWSGKILRHCWWLCLFSWSTNRMRIPWRFKSLGWWGCGRKNKRRVISYKRGMKQWGTGILKWVMVLLIDTVSPAFQYNMIISEMLNPCFYIFIFSKIFPSLF